MKYYISIGSNLGNKLKNLQDALKIIETKLLKNTKSSMVVETNAILPPDAPVAWNMKYLNMVVVGDSDIKPDIMLEQLKSIEKIMGRDLNGLRWSPRIIDLDILLVDHIVINTENLTIPHPALLDRDFLIYLLRSLHNYNLYLVHKESYPQIFKKIYDTFIRIENLNANDLYTNILNIKPKIVGIVNITEDSFSDGGQFKNVGSVVKHIEKLMNDGATIIDIGAQSTRPGAAILHNDETEYSALSLILNEISSLMSERKIHVSIDTFRQGVMMRLIENYDIYWINDVKSLLDDFCLKEISNANTKYCFMHSLGIPPNTANVLSNATNYIDTIMNWAQNYKNRLMSIGFNEDDIIMDPGIGFGKTKYQNINLIQNIHLFQRLNIPIIVGHSRKSYINTFANKITPMTRDIETIISSIIMKNSVDFLRIHNVKDYMNAVVAHDFLSMN